MKNYIYLIAYVFSTISLAGVFMEQAKDDKNDDEKKMGLMATACLIFLFSYVLLGAYCFVQILNN